MAPVMAPADGMADPGGGPGGPERAEPDQPRAQPEGAQAAVPPHVPPDPVEVAPGPEKPNEKTLVAPVKNEKKHHSQTQPRGADGRFARREDPRVRDAGAPLLLTPGEAAANFAANAARFTAGAAEGSQVFMQSVQSGLSALRQRVGTPSPVKGDNNDARSDRTGRSWGLISSVRYAGSTVSSNLMNSDTFDCSSSDLPLEERAKRSDSDPIPAEAVDSSDSRSRTRV